jgi:hypothetical protein
MTATIPDYMTRDRYWGSTLHLFSKCERLKDCFDTRYFDLTNATIKITALKRDSKPWSQSERFMLDLALHLFNERNKVNLLDMDYLDPNNKAIAMEANRMRFNA